MIYYKISFLIVLISVVCFSVDVDPNEAAQRKKVDVDPYEAAHRKKDILACKKSLHEFFGETESSKKCVQHAIVDLKLYGDYADELDDFVKKYYESFHSGVKLDKLILPEKFCNKREYREKKLDCEEALEIFKVPPKEDLEVPVYGSSNVGMITNAMKTKYGPSSSGSKKKKVKYSEPQGPSSSERSNDSMINYEDTEPMIVLKNALYYHVTFDPKEKKVFPEYNARNYFHVNGSYGFYYLHSIKDTIKIDKAKLLNLSDFCIDLYTKSKQQNTENEKFDNVEDVVATYLNLDGTRNPDF